MFFNFKWQKKFFSILNYYRVMKINRIQQYNNNVSFGSGLTSEFVRFAREVNPKDVETYLSKIGVSSDFKDNKTIAACIYQVVSIFKNLGLPVPKGIFAKKIADRSTYGLADTMGNVYFNVDNYCDIKTLDYFYNLMRKHRLKSASHFLRDFLHEFTHFLNFENIKSSGKNLPETFGEIIKIKVPLGLKDYILKRYNYYTEGVNLFEILAETMEARFSKILDPQTMMTSVNPFAELKFKNLNSISPKDNAFEGILRSIYDGDIPQIRNNLRVFSDSKYFS